MGGAEIIYVAASLLVWAAIISAIVYVVVRARRRSRERDLQLRSIEQKLDQLLDDAR